MLSGHSVVTPQGNDLTRSSPRNARPQSSDLADRAAMAQKVTLCARADLHLQNNNEYRERTHVRTRARARARTHTHTHTHTFSATRTVSCADAAFVVCAFPPLVT